MGVDDQFKQSALDAGVRNFVMRVTYRFEAEFPIFFGCIGKTLWFARDRVDLATGCADILDHTTISVAP
jgi:hypothetical protein